MKWLDGMRHRFTKQATFAALRTAGMLGNLHTQSLGLAIGRFAHLIPCSRDRLLHNLHAAGADASDATIYSYFRRLGLWMGQSLGVYRHGLEHSLAETQVEIDPVSIRNIDEAVARGRGVVLASPHMFWHEIVAGLLNRRHPVTALIRESKDPTWGEVKSRWYGTSLGLRTVLRPRRGSAARDMAAMLRVLRGGSVLGITPDIVTSRGSGIPIRLFDRTVSLSPGMILLAMRSGAPLITGVSRWVTDPACPNRERLVATFTPPMEFPRTGDRESTLRDGLQRWCERFEATLRRSPADWLFWLDKAWTRVLRQPAIAPARAA